MKKTYITFGAVRLPCITIGRGRPQVLITAGLHGDEHSQQLVIRQFLARPPKLARGSVVILPRLNPMGLKKNTEVNPLDGKNMNRVFPGNERSPLPSLRIARFVYDLACQSRAVIDLHNFTDPALSQTIFPEVGSPEVQQQSLAMCRQYGLPLIWRVRPRDPGMQGASGTLIYNAALAGMPSCGVELPPKDVLKQAELAAGVAGLRRVISLILTNRLTASAEQFSEAQLIDRKNITASADGIFIPEMKLGAQVLKGQAVGRIATGRQITETVEVPCKGLLTRLRRKGPVRKGQLLCNIGIKSR